MKKRYIALLFALLLLLIALMVANIYIAKNSDQIDRIELERVVTQANSNTIKATQFLVDQRISQVEQVPGNDGKDGVTTVIERQTTNVVTTPGKDGKDGADGRDGKDGRDGRPGKDAKQVILSTDPDTGDIIWRYEDETGWTLLLEACAITKSCGE